LLLVGLPAVWEWLVVAASVLVYFAVDRLPLPRSNSAAGARPDKGVSEALRGEEAGTLRERSAEDERGE